MTAVMASAPLLTLSGLSSEFMSDESDRRERDWITLWAILIALWAPLVTRGQVQEMIRTGAVPRGLLDALDVRLFAWLTKEAEPSWVHLWDRGRAEALAQAGRWLGETIVVNPIVTAAWRAEWVANRTGLLVRNFSDHQLRALRWAVGRYVVTGQIKSFSALVRMIRRVIGLTEGQAKALGAYRDVLVRAGTPTDSMERLVRARAEQLRLVRAQRIARTETQAAYQMGHYLGIRQAWEEGKLGETLLERVWMTATDPCPICGPLNGKVAGLHEAFVASTGSFLAPPIHPHCRCACFYKRVAQSTP